MCVFFVGLSSCMNTWSVCRIAICRMCWSMVVLGLYWCVGCNVLMRELVCYGPCAGLWLRSGCTGAWAVMCLCVGCDVLVCGL
ncbi:hypothetical protein FKM82_018472 [Ascaphus truei]